MPPEGSSKTTTLIGQVWKCSNAWSLLVLISREAWPFSCLISHARSCCGQLMIRTKADRRLARESALPMVPIPLDTSFFHCPIFDICANTVFQFSVAIARGSHPFPFRTRKLSLSAPMVLPGQLGGRVGRRRILLPNPFILVQDEGIFFRPDASAVLKVLLYNQNVRTTDA